MSTTDSSACKVPKPSGGLPSLLILGRVWPEDNASAAGLRDWSLVRIFREAGWKVTYASPAKANAFSERLEAMGIEARVVEMNSVSFDKWIAELRPEVAILDTFATEEQFGWRVAEHSPETLRILDTQDLHLLRRARAQALADGVPLADIYEARLPLAEAPHAGDALREIASIYRSDLTLLISDFELALAHERFTVPTELLELFPFCYDEPPAAVPGFADRAGFVVIGNFRHPPNADGVRWLSREIWPAIRAALPEAEVRVYGAYPPREMMALDDPRRGFRVLGHAPDQYAVLKEARVNLAPLRFGAGIKGKIADGWWSGAPAATTPIGAEGMRLHAGTEAPFGGIVAQTAKELAAAAVRLYTDETAWRAALATGRETLRTRFAHETNARALLDRVARARAERDAARSRNFVGAMLQHHFHRSTTYFAKWIEAKNARLVPPLQASITHEDQK